VRQDHALRPTGGPARRDDQRVVVADRLAALEGTRGSGGVDHGRGTQSLEYPGGGSVRKASVERQHCVAVVPATPEHFGKVRATGHSEGHEAVHL
jgi:hypothetical protein